MFTLDAYAWALHASGDADGAWEQIQLALAPGIRDARFFYHAGIIAAARGDEPQAERWLTLSLQTNPHTDVADGARAALGGLSERHPHENAERVTSVHH